MKIAFLTRVPRPFTGETLRLEPMGGTQSSLIYLAEFFAKAGHDVHIFCQTKISECVEGVFYSPVAQLARFSRKYELDFFIPVADESALKLGIKARYTLAWLHNDYPHLWSEAPDLRAELSKLLIARCDKVIAVSQWHASTLKRVFGLHDDHLWILPNGIVPSYFSTKDPLIKDQKNKEDPVRLVYTSVPNRGLGYLLDLFPVLQQRVSHKIELHLYSGFSIWGMSAEKDLRAAGALYERAQSMEGVVFHAPVSPITLAKKLQEADLWVYPQHPSAPLPQSPEFWVEAETFCLAALEAQAAGLPAVASALGALSETILDGETGLLVKALPMTSAYQEIFVTACQKLIEDIDLRSRLGLHAQQRAFESFDWQEIASRWLHLMEAIESTRGLSRPRETKFQTPVLSVIIPTYNRARNLKHCLESLTWQESVPFEVLVCDDGSSDTTREVVVSYQDRLNIRYRWQPDEGFRAAEARNIGIRMARGKYLVFLDSDLVVPPTFLEAHYKALLGHPGAVINSYVYRMQDTRDDNLGAPPSVYIPKHLDILKPDSRDRYQLFERGKPIEETYFLDSNAMSMSRKDMAKVGLFDGSFVGWGHEDTELGYRIANYKMPLILIKENAVAYHQYHYVSPAKDDERKENWERLTKKYGITTWYHPLWELTIDVDTLILENNKVSQRSAMVPVSSQVRWSLKTGDRLPLSYLSTLLSIDNGCLTKIQLSSFDKKQK